MAIDQVLLTGKGTFLTAEDKIDAFTLSNGTVIAGSRSRLSQLRFGGQVAYTAPGFMPYLGVYYIKDTERPDQAPVGAAVAANDDDAVQITVGINFTPKGPVYGGILYQTERSRSDVKNNQFLLNLGIRF
jgi:hypothetical protein